MPNLWARIESRQRFTFSFHRMATAMATAAVALSLVQEWEPAPIHDVLMQVVESSGLGPNATFMPIRLAVTGKKISPPIDYTLALLPKDVAMARIARAIR